ncbi:MAG: PIN domain-containing protein [Actinobacteria bacterium]|nr:PIN domain-containing protein [Actinomycetota bacterium]
MRVPSKVYVVDTNALLNDPEVIHSFSGAEVVVPAVVLKELDSLKSRRTDRRVRYHGRRATRMLFDASRNGHLLTGVALPNGSILRVDSTEAFDDLPADLDVKRADDQILALACSYNRRPGVKTTLVTNDLNLLLRGQALGLESYRFEGKLEHIRERRRTPLEWLRANRLTLALVVLALFFACTTAFFALDRPVVSSPSSTPFVDDPTLLQSLGVSPQFLEAQYRNQLSRSPSDVKALTNLANVLYDQQRYLEAVSYYRQVLDVNPTNANVRTDMGIAQLKLGHPVEAVASFEQAISDAPSLALPHYNLGIALAQQGDLTTAIKELKTAVQLGENGGGLVPVATTNQLIAQLEQKLASTQ